MCRTFFLVFVLHTTTESRRVRVPAWYRYKSCCCTKIMSAADDESYRDDQSECPSDASDLSIELLDDPAGNLDDLSAFVDHSEEELVVDD